MTSLNAIFRATALVLALGASQVSAQQLKLASPQRGSWEGAVPELGQQQGIFRKHGLELDILYTAGGGETLQTVISGAVDIGLSAGTLAILGAAQKGAPIRIIGASSTGSRELFWYVVADSRFSDARRERQDHRLFDDGLVHQHRGPALHRRIQAQGQGGCDRRRQRHHHPGDDAAGGRRLVGRPLNLKPLEEGKIRIIARAGDLAAIRGQTIRVQIANANALRRRRTRSTATSRPTAKRWTGCMRARRDRAIFKFSGFAEDAVKRTLQDFIPKESLQTREVMGLDEAMADAVRFKYLSSPLTARQLSELIQIPKGR